MKYLCRCFFSKCVWRDQNYDKEGWVGGQKGCGIQFCSDCSEEREKGVRVVMVRGMEFWVGGKL